MVKVVWPPNGRGWLMAHAYIETDRTGYPLDSNQTWGIPTFRANSQDTHKDTSL